MGSEEYPKVAEYFVVAGITDTSTPLDEDLAFPNAHHKLSDQRKDPITDIVIIDKTLEENCPQGFTCIEQTPSGLPADLNHGSLTAHSMYLCYRRGKDKAPLVDLGVYYEGMETVRKGISVLDSTPAGRSANVNNKSGMGSHPIYLTYRRAKESAPQNSLVVTDICVILTNKGERAPYAFWQIDKNLNKGLIGSSVYLCFKKSMRQVDLITYKAGLIGRYPREDVGSFPLPATVPLFCLPMGATIECWSKETRHPLPTFSSFVLTNETSEKVFGAVVSFHESYPEERLSDEERYKLGLLRGDGLRSRSTKTVHTNKAICLLSRWPMFGPFRDVLFYLYQMTVSPNAHSVPVERHIAHFIHNVPFPSPQRPRVQYQMSPFHLTILTRPQITPIPLSGASFLALLDDLGPENTITLLVLALTEHKIVIHSLRPAEITRVAEALITLLFPFKWQCTYVPLCPLEMGYVLEAPCPFIVAVDSRYFDLYEPPSDVACVNLDTNSITIMDDKKHISWKLLPRKPAKLLRTTLQKYFKEVKEFPREESIGASVSTDLDSTRSERHRHLELAIQEAVLKLMAVMMKGYRQYLLPITEAPNVGTADPSSLFNIQEFVKSREKSSQRFFTSLIGTQLFSSFIEERSVTSFIGGEGAAGRSSSLVFFDECIDRLSPDLESVRLIEADDTLKSEHTVMIMAPDETGLPPGVGYQYTTFPELQDELFMVEGPDAEQEQEKERPRRKSDTFTFVRRTKQEVRTMQKVSRLHSGNPQLWARLLLSHTYGAWFACLPSFVLECRHKSAALRTALNALHTLNERKCTPLPDETFYRMLLHLCSVYNKPALAVRVFNLIRATGTQLSAITYGLYNKAVLEGTWPASNRDGYMLWQKLRHVLLATLKFRYGLRRRSAFTSSEGSSDLDTTSRTSAENSDDPIRAEQAEPERLQSTALPSKVKVKADVSKKANLLSTSKHEDDSKSTGGQSDHGYNSMPKDQIRRGSPLKTVRPMDVINAEEPTPATHARNNSGSTETTDSVISSIDSPRLPNLERSPSNRSAQPPSTLDIPPLNGEVADGSHFPDAGLKSDDTLVNGDSGEPFSSLAEQLKSKGDDAEPHRARASPVSPTMRGKAGRARSIVRSAGSYSGALCDEATPPGSPDSPGVLASNHSSKFCVSTNHVDDNVANGFSNTLVATGVSNQITDVALLKPKSPKIRNLKLNHLSAVNGTRPIPANGLRNNLTSQLNQVHATPLLEVTDFDTPTSTNQSRRTTPSGSKPDVVSSPLFSPSMVEDNVFSEKKLDNSPVTSPSENNGSSESSKTLHCDDSNLLSPEHNRPRASPRPTPPASASPATPEIANLFGSDIKFFSSLSDSDQKRYQELCGRRPSNLDPDQVDKYRATRHGSLMLPSSAARGRSSTSLYTGGGISPLIGQTSFPSGSHPNTPTSRGNFDNMTAEDLMFGGGSPTRSVLAGRSSSGSILTNKSRSPSGLRATSDSPSRKKSARKLAGSNNLVINDGIPMLTSTPLRTLVEPSDPLDGNSHLVEKRSEGQGAPSDPLQSSNSKMRKSRSLPRSKQEVVREDISHLAQDPLSPGSHDPLSSFTGSDGADGTPSFHRQSNSSGRHLLEEIEDYLQNDSLTRSSSDATTLVDQKRRMQSPEEEPTKVPERKLHRKGSLPTESPKTSRRGPPPPLQRSLTYHEDPTAPSTNSWFGSGSKLNSLWKATTVGAASKVKKAATNLAKDLNETMQASIAYYTPEKIKGSLSDLRGSQEDILSKSSSDFSGSRKQLLQAQDHHSSQSSLRSVESIHSAQETRGGHTGKVPRRAGGRGKKSHNPERPRSVPQFDSSRPTLASSRLSIPGAVSESSADPNITSSMTSLNMRSTYDIEVVISSCSRCHNCSSLVYDEEIMAGWFGDDSSLNTRCPFCSSLFVPFLNTEITDYRSLDRPLAGAPDPARNAAGNPETFSSSFNVNVISDSTENTASEVATTQNPPTPTAPSPSPKTPEPQPGEDGSLPPHGEAPRVPTEDGTTLRSTPDPASTAGAPAPLRDDVSESRSDGAVESRSMGGGTPQSPRVLEPITAPYLSPLVLRKELESLLENEGTAVLTEAGFVDHHPILYWNLVWYFRRLNLHSNLFILLLQSQLVQTGSEELPTTTSQSQATKGNVMIHVMWDNLALHEGKPPLYFVWHQLATSQAPTEHFAYSASFLMDIRESIKKDDVRGPLVAVLNELNVQQGVRRSAYREILYLILVALGKSSIDVDAFDREYRRAYDALTPAELALAKKCDSPPDEHCRDCRDIFGLLDLCK